MTIQVKRLARWESPKGKHWVELLYDGTAATYRGNGCGGCFGVMTEVAALELMGQIVAGGRFLPDCAKKPMVRVV